MSKIKYICSNCGRDQILFDAYAIWDEDKQEMVLQNTFDYNICNHCGEEKTATETEIE